MRVSRSRWVPVWAWGSLLAVMVGVGGLVGLLVAASLSARWVMVGAAAAHTIVLVGLALVVVVPSALAWAIALQLLASRPFWRRVLATVAVSLEGVPTVVFGLAALAVSAVLGPVTAICALAAVSIPPLALALDRTMTAIEPEERLAATALGASSIQVLAQVVGPASTRVGLAAIARCGLRMMGIVAPLLLIVESPFEPLPLAALRAAAAGDLSSAAGAALVLLVGVIAGRAAVGMVDRRPTWRLP